MLEYNPDLGFGLLALVEKKKLETFPSPFEFFERWALFNVSRWKGAPYHA
jgi:hypothetical protein